MDENPVALLNVAALHEAGVAGGHGDEQARGVLERPALGDGQDLALRGVDVLGKGALAGAKDARADGVLWLLRGVRGERDDDAGELDAGDPGECCFAAC